MEIFDNELQEINPKITVEEVHDDRLVHNYVFKAIVVGDAGVGKTSMLKALNQQPFNLENTSTIGIDFFVKTYKINANLENRYIKLPSIFKIQQWDCAGQERYRGIVKSYFRYAQIIILAFDVTNHQSFANLKYWYEILKEHIDIFKPEIEIIVVGNKKDLQKDRSVQTNKAKDFAHSINASYIEVSAKNFNNLNELFVIPLKNIIAKIMKGQIKVENETDKHKIQIRHPKTKQIKRINNDCCNIL